jgi:hypothetical protein
MSDGPIEALKRKKKELKDGLAILSKRGAPKVTSYNEGN